MNVEIGSNFTAVLLALIAIIPATIAAIYARNAGKQANETHELVNNRMSELLTAQTSVAHAEGVLSGEQSQRDRMAPAIDSEIRGSIRATADNTERIAENTDPGKEG